MEILKTMLQVSSKIFGNIVYFITIYYLCLSFFGLYRKKYKTAAKPEKSFALIVAAHNEETVIQDIIGSLKRLDYPKELYDIFVIADNCTDRTAEKAKSVGALVFERFNKDKRGKGYALEWMFEKIFKMERRYDAVVIFDADNLASKNFLLEINRKLCEGFKVVQGFLDSKNPNDTWITGSYSIAFWTSNRMFQLSRNNLGLSNQLGGTGFAIDVNTLQELGWGATCLTEDLEFTCKLVLNGHKVGWAHDAVIYDEKPLNLKQSWYQRKRWMQGFADVSSRYFFKLLKRAVTKFSFTALDCALYSIQPIIIILTCIGTLVTFGAQIGGIAHSIISFLTGNVNATANVAVQTASLNQELLKIGGILVVVMQFIYTPLILVLERKLSLRMFLYYVIYPVYAMTWLPISVQGIIDKNKREWNHTLHTRSVNITELEKAN